MTLSPIVLAVDDDGFTRCSLAHAFANAGIVARTYASGAELLATADLSVPAVLLFDVMMPGMSGLELHALLRDSGIALPVIFLTGRGDVPMAVSAMRRGAVDFVEKPFDGAALVGRVRKAFARLDEDAAQRAATVGRNFARLRDTLTRREGEVLALMLIGRTNKEIADALGISTRTIDIHRANVMHKSAANNLAELVRMSFAAARPDQSGMGGRHVGGLRLTEQQAR